MNRKEAIIAMLDGKVVKNQKGERFKFHDAQFVFLDERGFWANNHNPLLYDDEYELVKQTKTIKLWQFMFSRGCISDFFYTEDKYKYWVNGKLKDHGGTEKDKWIKTNCFIEVEI